MEDLVKLEMAVGEACTNIVEHAYASKPLKFEIEIAIACYGDRLEVVIQDFSTIDFAFGENQAHDDIDGWMASGKRRGLGIFIIQSFVDKVEHRYVNGTGNELKLIKFFA